MLFELYYHAVCYFTNSRSDQVLPTSHSREHLNSLRGNFTDLYRHFFDDAFSVAVPIKLLDYKNEIASRVFQNTVARQKEFFSRIGRSQTLGSVKNSGHTGQDSVIFDLLSKNYFTDDQKMEVSVTNIDLAGDIKFNQSSAGRNIRVLKDTNFIRLCFNYQVKDGNGELLKEGQYELKELTRSSSSRISINRFERIKHFVKPLKNWFSTTFAK